MKADQYLQICVAAKQGCDGPCLSHVLRRVIGFIEASFAVLSDVDLVGPTRPQLSVGSEEQRVVSIEELLAAMGMAEQVVWANVFLCRSLAQANTLTADEDYIESLLKADALVRVVDAGYYYVYGPISSMLGLSKDLGGEILQGKIGDLEFPE